MVRADTTFERVCVDVGAAHQAAIDGYTHAKTLLAMGNRVKVSVAADLDPVTVKQRNLFHGPILGQISDQVRVDGRRYVQDVWKEHLRDVFLPPVWVSRRKPFVFDRATGKWRPSRRAVPVLERRSTEDLGVKGYSDLIDKVLAYAATEWGVQFVFEGDEREEARYVPRKRQAAAPKAEVKQLENADG